MPRPEAVPRPSPDVDLAPDRETNGEAIGGQQVVPAVRERPWCRAGRRARRCRVLRAADVHVGASAGLSVEEHPDDRALSRRRLDRPLRARHRPGAGKGVGQERHHRQPGRRERHDRHRDRDQDGPRRPRAARAHLVLSGDRRRAREAAVRSGAGHRAGRHDRQSPDADRDPSFGAGEERQGARRAGEEDLPASSTTARPERAATITSPARCSRPRPACR